MKYAAITSFILIILSILWLILALYLAAFVMTGSRQTLDEAMQWQSGRYDTSFYDELEKDDYTVTSYDGYILNVQLLHNPTPTDKYVIISHGYTDNRIGSLKYAKLYLALGYHCIIYDLRGHGLNKSTFTTYGIREGQDIAALVEDTRKRYPNISQLGLHGESLGAASTITALQYKPDVDFVVADCGFADIEGVLREGYRKAHVPSFLVDVADIGARIRYHFSLKKMRPIDALSENEIPILFIHGAQDDFILPDHSERMAKATKGQSVLHLIDGAGHAESVLTQPDDYMNYLSEFIQNLN